MKKVIIGSEYELIHISDINKDFNGLLFAYKNDNIVGTIVYYDNNNSSTWLYLNSLEVEDYTFASYSLETLIKSILKEDPTITFFTT